MRFERIMGFIKYIIISLAVICIDKADFNNADEPVNANYVSEILDPYSYSIDSENYAFSSPKTRCRVPRQSNFTNTLRTSSQAQRQNTVNQSRNGFTLVKAGKSMNEYTTSLFLRSIINFPSGLSESNHHLIGLRKLII